jgi:transposase-like protein
MDPRAQFCHNPDCPARGQPGPGNIRVHSRKERRHRCTTCARTFAATRDTLLYRLKKPTGLVLIVLTLLCHGCPLQAIVAAFGLDERTVADWRDLAGRHGQRGHEHQVLQGQIDLGHVQADELYVKTVAGQLWMALAMAVPSRLWLGGVSPKRDLALITAVVRMVRSAARSLAIFVCIDGLASYVTAFAGVFRDPVRTGRRGRPRLRAAAGQLLGQVVKHRAGRPLTGVTRRVVRGTEAAIAAVLQATGTGTGINTAYIEAQRHVPQRLEPACASQSGDRPRGGDVDRRDVSGRLCLQLLLAHGSLRTAAGAREGRKWRERTPAMAAGLTDHRRTMREWLTHPVPLLP